jgi:S-adenosyl-L-methionine hydrolase (adenosine-forming)
MRPILFLSDLGLKDEFVGVCQSVIARIAPDARVVDLSHGVNPMDVTLGALLLADSVPYLPEDAVLLAVVDPGVGTERKAVAVRAANGTILVGPDNGLLSLAWEALGGAEAAFEITSKDVVLSPTSNVFHGRDVFAPAAAHLAIGVAPEELGPPVEPGSLIRVETPEPEVEGDVIRCRVLDVDRFGNLQLNVRPGHLEAAGLSDRRDVRVDSAEASALALLVDTYAEVQPGGYGVVTDAWGWVTVIRYEANAASGLMVGRDDAVWLRRADG